MWWWGIAITIFLIAVTVVAVIKRPELVSLFEIVKENFTKSRELDCEEENDFTYISSSTLYEKCVSDPKSDTVLTLSLMPGAKSAKDE